MDDRVQRDILRRLAELERCAAQLRLGVITASAPLAVKLGDASVSVKAKRLSGVTTTVGATVVVLTRGHDLLVIGQPT